MQTISVTPSQHLSHLVREFSFTTIKPDELSTNDHIVIDDGCYDFVFFKGVGTTFSHGEEKSIKITNSAFTIHQLKPPYKMHFEEEIQLFIAKVQPWTNALFFPSSIQPGVINLQSIYPNIIDSLYKQLFQATEIQDKVNLLEEFIHSQSIEENETFLMVKNICEKIYESQGAVKVNELVDLFKMNRQVLNKKFKQQVNYTIKQFIIIVRIISLIKYKIKHDQESLTSVAYHFDYTDQAHFNNDFKKVCGISPSSFFKNLPVFFKRHRK